MGTGAGRANRSCGNAGADCTPAQMASADLFGWYEDVKNLLPSGRGASVAVAPVPPVDQYTITVSWPERGQAAPVSYVLTFSQ